MAPVSHLSIERLKRNIRSVQYMSGLDIEFPDEASKRHFLRCTYIIKHHLKGKRSRKISTANLILAESKNSVTIRCPLTERDVTAIEIVDAKSRRIHIHEF